METLKQVLIRRDGLSAEQVDADIAACRADMLEAIDAGDFDEAEQIFTDWFGLEPDYLLDIL